MAGPEPGSEDWPLFTSDPRMEYLIIVNSPYATGMGGCAVNMVGDQSALYNPGALGVYHLDKNISFSVPFATDWLPVDFGDLELRTYNFSAGVSLNQIMPDPLRKFNLGCGVAYSRTEMDYGELVRVDVYADSLGYQCDRIEAGLYTLSFAADYYVRVGVGYTIKKSKSTLEARPVDAQAQTFETDADMHDYGIYAELPLARFINPIPDPTNVINSQQLYEITPSLAYVKANMGDDIIYEYFTIEEQVYPSPEISRLGFGLYGSIKMGGPTLASININHEIETQNYEYGNLKDGDKLKKWGLELGVLDAVFVRLGSVKSDPYGEGRTNINSWGIGFSLNGAITLLIRWDKLHLGDNILGYLLKNVDLRVDYAEYTGNATQALDGTSFFKVSLSL
jgi:hypothetical protein